MKEHATSLRCIGCGAAPAEADPYPFRCPNAGHGDADHVLVRHLDPALLVFPVDVTESEPFIRYRTLLHSYHRATAGGMTDSQYVEMVHRIDAALKPVAGMGFGVTPFGRSGALSDALGFSADGGLWVKQEAGNVAGSHKGRHLMGVLLHLEVSQRLGLVPVGSRPDLAIASCGNAALAAAVIAAAMGRTLRVFVPREADARIVAELTDLGARVVACARRPGSSGDPTYLALRDAVAGGAVPFTCQGSENGLCIEGGATLGYEMVSELTSGGPVDHLVVQVGGGALASACVASFDEAVALGALPRGPRIHTVQTVGAHPLERAYQRVAAALPGDRDTRDVGPALRHAATHRSQYMWPWEEEPRSVAGGILDDEAYDWLAVVGGMLRSGGQPVVVADGRLLEARDMATAAGHAVSATGSAGLAGVLDLLAAGSVGPDDRVAVVFTGAAGIGESR